MYSSVYAALALASLRRAAINCKPEPEISIFTNLTSSYDDAIKRANRRTLTRIFDPPPPPRDVDATLPVNGDALPLTTRSTRIDLTSTRRHVHTTRTLCVACACVALRASRRTLYVRGRIINAARVRHSMRVRHSGVACDACGRVDDPYTRDVPYTPRSLHARRFTPPRPLPLPH
jgi:hypothetical protein